MEDQIDSKRPRTDSSKSQRLSAHNEAMIADNDSLEEDLQEPDEDDILMFDFGRQQSQTSGHEQAQDTRDSEYNFEMSDQDPDEDLGSPEYAKEAVSDILTTEETVTSLPRASNLDELSNLNDMQMTQDQLELDLSDDESESTKNSGESVRQTPAATTAKPDIKKGFRSRLGGTLGGAASKATSKALGTEHKTANEKFMNLFKKRMKHLRIPQFGFEA